MQSRFGRRTWVVAAFTTLAACAAPTPSGTRDVAPESTGTRAAGPHVMRMQFPDRSLKAQAAAPAGAKLEYFGGPVLSKVKVFTVFWNDKVNFQSQLNSFYSGITNSAYFDWLNEYNTPTQTIGRGSLLGSAVDPSPPAATSITNVDIQTELSRLIDAKTVPAPDADTLYMVHFPPGVSIDLDGNKSCQFFCAYHNTYQRGTTNVYYGVIPDQGGGCAGGCGTDPQLVNNLTSVSSHELIEAVTDAAVGLATSFGPPLAWYDRTNGEIGDICNGEQGKVGSFVVQTEWSNKNNACIVTGGSCTPQCTGKQCGSDGCGGSCGTCPTGESCDANGQCQTGCTPQCTGKQCGPDGCGGSCGTCRTGESCDANGQCQPSCTPQCTNKQCGPDGCGGVCGSCPTGQTCDANGQCQGQNGCVHDECQTGGKLTTGCDSCATRVCSFDSFCCSTAWDSLCVILTEFLCQGKSCSLF